MSDQYFREFVTTTGCRVRLLPSIGMPGYWLLKLDMDVQLDGRSAEVAMTANECDVLSQMLDEGPLR